MMAAYPNTMQEVSVMGALPKHNTQFVEVDANDARHFGYLGPRGTLHFFRESVIPRMAKSDEDNAFAEALTDDGWVTCTQGGGIPLESLAVRLYPAAFDFFLDVADHHGPQAMYKLFIEDYLQRLTCP